MAGMDFDANLFLLISTERKTQRQSDWVTEVVPRIDVILENRDPLLESKIDVFLRDMVVAGVPWSEIEQRGWNSRLAPLRSYVPIPSAAFGEVLLFCSFALRQLVSLGPRDVWANELALLLIQFAEQDGLVHNAIEGIVSSERPIQPPGFDLKGLRRLLIKSFEAELFFGKSRFSFVMRPRGFGLLGRGVGEHALRATIELAHSLTSQRLRDAEYAHRISIAAGLCGSAFLSGFVTVKNQQQVSLEIMREVIHHNPLVL